MATNMITCPRCSAQNSSFDSTCRNCGASLPLGGGPMEQGQNQSPMGQKNVPGADKKVLAGVLAIIFGGLGVHKFILGYQNEGFILLGTYVGGIILAVITCGIAAPIVLVPSIIGVIEGIMYLTKSDEEFVQTYIIGKKPWF